MRMATTVSRNYNATAYSFRIVYVYKRNKINLIIVVKKLVKIILLF